MSEHRQIQTAGTLFIEQVDLLDVGLWTSTGPLGSTFEVQVELTGPLDHLGFVCDFSLTKQIIKSALKTKIDHRFIAPAQHPDYTLSFKHGRVTWSSAHDTTAYAFEGPADSVYALDVSEVTIDALEAEVTAILAAAFDHHQLPITTIKVKLYEESRQSSDAVHLQYTHGISAHQGLCHRMWHGHRSRVVVLRNQERSPELESYLQTQLFQAQGFHLAEPNQIEGSIWPLETLGPNHQTCKIQYNTQHGLYQATMPASQVFLMSHYSSVESLACTLAHKLKLVDPLASIQVRLYEGITKGGIYELPANSCLT